MSESESERMSLCVCVKCILFVFKLNFGHLVFVPLTANSVLSSFSNPAGCQPCKENWIEFHNKCYLFYEEAPPWKTWGDSRLYCQAKDADLVAIDSLREQVTPREVDSFPERV